MIDETTQEFMLNFGSRRKAVEFPHGMNVSAHLMKDHGIPKQWHHSELIYHYTNAAGLRGILDERAFWATKTPFLNDPTEVIYAVEIVTRVLRERSKGIGPVADIANAVLEKFCAPKDDTYITSFCRDGDLLSQWRGYGANGGGYSLGFSFPIGKAPPMQMAWLIEVIYDENLLSDAIDVILSIFVDHLAASVSAWAMENVVDLFPTTLDVLWLAFKHPAYREEREVRLLVRRSQKIEDRIKDAVRFGKVHYRSSSAEVIPFVKIGMSFSKDEPAPLLPLRRIVVGPGVRFNQNKEALEQMLEDFGYEDVEVAPSRVPFVP